jgi:hypothetical protein
MLKNNIKFFAIDDYSENVIRRPSPSSDYIPKWWKEMDPYFNNSKLSIINGFPNFTAKKCLPMLDAISMGYMIPLWADVNVSQKSGSPSIYWKINTTVFDTHSFEMTNDVDVPDGYSYLAYKMHNKFVIKTPPGWSCLFVHPMGHTDLPFYSIPAVVDTDKHDDVINPVIWIKNGFEGIIEEGTPILQVIPFKRESWKAEYLKITVKDLFYNQQNGISKIIANHYGKKTRSKRSYK